MGMKTLVYTPDVRCVIRTAKGDVDISSDLVRGNLQRQGSGVSFFQATVTNKGLRYNNAFRRMDSIVVQMKRLVWVTVFSGYLNEVPALQIYPGTVTIKASCTLKRLKYTFWDPGLQASAALFDQQGIDAANGGDNKDAGLGFMLKNILEKVGGWDPDQIVVGDFPTSFVDYMVKGAESGQSRSDEALAYWKKLFDYDEVMSGGAAGSGSTAGTSMGPVTANQEGHAREIHAASLERNMGIEGTLRALMCGLVESELRILANKKVPASYDFPHEGEGDDGTSCGIFQQQQNGAWGSLAENMNARASAGLFLNAMLRLGNWKSLPRGQSVQTVQGSAYPDKYAQREADAQAIITKLGLTDAAGGGGPSGTATKPPAGGTNKDPQTGQPVPGPAPTTAEPAATEYGLPTGSNVSYGSAGFPDWVYALAKQFNIQASTYAGHQEDQRNEAGYAPNPNRQNRGIDWSGGVAEMQKFAEYLLGIAPGKPQLEQIIWMNPNTGQKIGWAGRTDVSSGSYYSSAYGGHQDHVHTRQSASLDGSSSMAGAGGAGGSTPGGGSTFDNKLAKNLFGYLFTPGDRYNSGVSNSNYGEVASVNDEPLLNTVNAICAARLCKFQSAPTGEFLAYYPDYFGLDGKPATLDLEDIELKDLSIQLNDDALTTHMFTAGTWSYQGTGSPSDLGWIGRSGVATVENEWLFKRMIESSAITPDTTNAQELLERFGIRPLKEEFPSISGLMSGNYGIDLLMATQRFMQQWAMQSATNVSFTFMPDLFPGMRINIVGHDVTVYVDSVNHTFDFATGFTTTATIMAPSKTSALAGVINGVATEGGGGTGGN